MYWNAIEVLLKSDEEPLITQSKKTRTHSGFYNLTTYSFGYIPFYITYHLEDINARIYIVKTTYIKVI